MDTKVHRTHLVIRYFYKHLNGKRTPYYFQTVIGHLRSTTHKNKQTPILRAFPNTTELWEGHLSILLPSKSGQWGHNPASGGSKETHPVSAQIGRRDSTEDVTFKPRLAGRCRWQGMKNPPGRKSWLIMPEADGLCQDHK